MNVFGQLKNAQLESKSADLAGTLTGGIYFHTTELRCKFANGTVPLALLANDQKCVFGTNGTAASNIRLNRAAAGVLQFVTGDDTTAEGSLSTALAQLSFLPEKYATASRPTGVTGRMIYDTDLNLIAVYNGSAWVPVGSATADSFINWQLTGDSSPLESPVDGFDFLDFDAESDQEVYAVITVPLTYIAGTQIKLQKGLYCCSATTNKVFFKAVTALIEPGTTVLGTYTNEHTSTNTEQTVDGTTNEFNSVSDIDLTDGSGEINSVAVAPGDVLRIKLYRDNTNESVSAAADARLVRNSFVPKFSI